MNLLQHHLFILQYRKMKNVGNDLAQAISENHLHARVTCVLGPFGKESYDLDQLTLEGFLEYLSCLSDESNQLSFKDRLHGLVEFFVYVIEQVTHALLVAHAVV